MLLLPIVLTKSAISVLFEVPNHILDGITQSNLISNFLGDWVVEGTNTHLNKRVK